MPETSRPIEAEPEKYSRSDYEAELFSRPGGVSELVLTPNVKDFAAIGLESLKIEVRGFDPNEIRAFVRQSLREALHEVEASKADLGVAISIPEFGISDCSPTNLRLPEQQPLHRDELTDQLGPLERYNRKRLDQINELLGPGRKIFVRSDVENVNVANQSGLRAVVDELLPHSTELIDEAGLRPSSSIRAGGDEFDILLAYDGERHVSLLRGVAEAYHRERGARLEQHPEETAQALTKVSERLALQFVTAKLRESMRSRRGSAGLNAFSSVEAVNIFIEQQLREQFPGELPENEHRPDSLLSVLAKSRAPEFLGGASERLLAMNTVRVSFYGDITPEVLLKLEAFADLEISRRKREGVTDDKYELIEFTPNAVTLRRAQRQELLQTDQLFGRIDRLENQIQNLERALPPVCQSMVFDAILRRVQAELQLRDPTTLALRANMIAGFEVRQIFGVTEEKEMYLYQIDVAGAGVINNNEGRERLDEIVSEAASTASRFIQGLRPVRSSGGLVTFMTDHRLSAEEFVQLGQALNSGLAKTIRFGEPDLDVYVKAAQMGKQPAALRTIELTEFSRVLRPDEKASAISEDLNVLRVYAPQ